MWNLIICILAGLVAVIAIIIMAVSKDDGTREGAIVTTAIASIITIGSLLFGVIVSIPNGNIGILVQFGRVTGQTLEAGLHWKNIIESVVVLSIQTQLFEDNATAASKDLQDVSTKIAINYKLDPKEAPTVYRTIGREYIAVIANPLIQETVKEITAKYNAEDMILKRSQVKQDISEVLTQRLALRGIISESVSIINFDFSAEFTKAIESKVVAVQKVLEAENKLRQTEVEARQAEQIAKGQAAATIALAEGQAQANALLSKSLTPEIIQYMFIQSIKDKDKIITVPGGVALTLPEPK